MKKIIAATIVAVALIVATLATTASATDPYRKLQRQINKLQNQVSYIQNQLSGVKSDVSDLNYDVWHCQWYFTDDPQIADDGSVGYPMMYDSSCA